jgi:hypothetical protein
MSAKTPDSRGWGLGTLFVAGFFVGLFVGNFFHNFSITQSIVSSVVITAVLAIFYLAARNVMQSRKQRPSGND